MLAQLEQPVRLQGITSEGFVFQYKAGVWDCFQDVGPHTNDLQAEGWLHVVHAGAHNSWHAAAQGADMSWQRGPHLRGDLG